MWLCSYATVVLASLVMESNYFVSDSKINISNIRVIAVQTHPQMTLYQLKLQRYDTFQKYDLWKNTRLSSNKSCSTNHELKSESAEWDQEVSHKSTQAGVRLDASWNLTPHAYSCFPNWLPFLQTQPQPHWLTDCRAVSIYIMCRAENHTLVVLLKVITLSVVWSRERNRTCFSEHSELRTTLQI